MRVAVVIALGACYLTLFFVAAAAAAVLWQ